MTELLKNAWLGWKNLTECTKLPALLGAGLIWLWLSVQDNAKKTLTVYTAVAASCCVFPVTAAALMLYQTKFYDYQWVWSIVPMTAVIAWSAVELVMKYWPGLKGSDWKKGLPIILLLGALLILGSGLVRISSADESKGAEKNKAQSVLTQILENAQEGEICLWAPSEILEYTRETEPSIRLLYGRNLWDEWLNAYSYDAPSEEMEELYLWMEEEAVYAEADEIARFVQTALDAGANCVLLPKDAQEKAVSRAGRTLHMNVTSLGEYYAMYIGNAD